MNPNYVHIQMTIHEAHQLLALLFERLNPADAELIQVIEAALEDASIEDDPTIDE